MKCPLDEILMVEYLEGELDPEERGVVEAHFRHCRSCREELEELRRAGGLAREGREEYLLPEAFWQESLRAVGRATWEHDHRQVLTGGVVVRLRRYYPALLAAAAVLALALAGTLELWRRPAILGPDPQLAATAMQEALSPEDSLRLIQGLVTQYQQAVTVLEAMEALGSGVDGGVLPVETTVFPVGRSVYEGLMDLEENQFEAMMVELAGI